MGVKREWLWRWGRALGQAPFTLGVNCRCPAAGTRFVRKDGTLIDAHAASTTTAARCRCGAAQAVLPSRLWEAYSLAVLMVCAPSTIAVLLSDVQKRAAEDTSPRAFTKTDRVVSQLDVILVMLSGNMAVVQTLLSRRHVRVFVEQLSTVDRLLQARPPDVQLSLLLWLTSVSMLSALDIVYVYQSGGALHALSHVPNQANYLLIYTMEAMFAEDAHCIFRRFKTLNDRLETSCLEEASRYPLELRPGMTPVGETSWKLLFAGPVPLRGGPRSDRGSGSDGRTRSRTMSDCDVLAVPGAPGVPVHQLEDAHALLCSSVVHVTRRYGTVLLIDVLNLLLHFVTTSYFFFSVIVLADAHKETRRRSYVALQTLWMLAHLSRLVLLVRPCSSVKEEANKTGALVGTFLNTLHPGCKSHKQLEMFSMQLMHQRVTFSPCGLFELDLSLVVSLLGAVTTYLVVLLQIKVPSTHDVEIVTANQSSL